jgi:CelD/BcsL family acetyltransferase involved in cellulose biosynthesis
MQTIAFSSWDEIVPYAESWDRLARGVPFRSWAWLSSWWRHYGPQSPADAATRLMVLGVLDASGRLAGIAPWYLNRSAAKGWVLRWLGSGEVCSDYASILSMPEDADRVSESIAAYLTGEHCAPGARHCWDLLEIDGVDALDSAVTRLLRQLGERGCSQHENSPQSAWRLALPKTWEEYLAMLSKGHRKKLRRADRDLFQTGRAVLHAVEDCRQLEPALQTLIDLHQRRRQMLGEPGCFASPRYTAFHREITQRLLSLGHLQLLVLNLDGRAVAAEYHMYNQGVTYVYQAGIDPQRLDMEPGNLITAAAVRRAIEQGGRAVDFLRGDEPYKAHFRATARPLLALRIVPNRTASRLRNNLWLAGRGVKRWLNQTSQRSTLQAAAAVTAVASERTPPSLSSLSLVPSS